MYIPDTTQNDAFKCFTHSAQHTLVFTCSNTQNTQQQLLLLVTQLHIGEELLIEPK